MGVLGGSVSEEEGESTPWVSGCVLGPVLHSAEVSGAWDLELNTS